ncbi:hypothetical protein AMS68_003552 [Peltaster fructicola]|uniref:Nitrogen regulatory protein areA GATA-like domain-containing protein n=1 Tax=Peltaster fructicola TaxID=286661 RepID=A0A6H0XTR3_9PEZI|nr:hypothetical protein AMS68_003552 [Peltaster fructicola]
MAEVLSPQPDSQTAFYTSQDHSATSTYFISPNLAAHNSNSVLNAGAASSLRSHPSSTSLSSRTSTSDFSNLLSLATPPSSVGSSLEDKYRQELDEDDDDYPHFEFDTQFIDHDDEQAEQEEQASTDTTISDTSLPTPTVVDDTAVGQQPSQHVDYLSHNWREEDVWSSWRHIVSQRRVYGQQSRLENAAWRTWVKNKYKLRTVSPETLNWLKESDVTWLYGPLKPAQSHPISQPESETESRISKNNSFILNKKPILKKRSMSEVMLQRSLSTSSLLQQAAASVQAQGRRAWRQEDFPASALVSEASSRDAPASVCSTSSSGTQTPSECREKKHIRFDDTVEQCIAVEAKPEEYDDDESDTEERPGSSLSSNSSDEGLVMMRKPRRPGMYIRHSSSRGSRSSSQSRKTIETLPSTTLKYRTDSPEVSEQQQQAAMAKFGSRPRLSPSASQETLRPSRPSRNFLLGNDEDNDEEAEETSWSFGSSNPRSSLGAAASSSENLKRSALPHSRSSMEHHHQQDDESSRQLQGLESEPGAYGVQGLRRTESGMFMPEDDEDDMIATGLFGRISETVNTARDIAHVIWNVGWRK